MVNVDVNISIQRRDIKTQRPPDLAMPHQFLT